MRTGCAIDQPYGMEILDDRVRAASDPVRGLHLDQLAKDDFLGGLFGHLTEHGRSRWLMIIETTARHTPATGDGSATGVLGREQAPAGGDDRVRRKTLPDGRPYVVSEYQPGITSLSAHLRTRLVGDRAHQESKGEFARAGAVGFDGPDDDVAEVECKDVRIGTVIEDYLERGLTLFCDADDQHLVIMAQCRVSCGRRCSAGRLVRSRLPGPRTPGSPGPADAARNGRSAGRESGTRPVLRVCLPRPV